MDIRRALASILVASLGSVYAVSDAGAASRCFGQSAPGYKREEIQRTRDVRLYYRTEVGYPADEGDVMACWRRTGRVFWLGADDLGSGIGDFEIRGRHVAYTSSNFSRGSLDTSVEVGVVDVRKGRIVHRWSYQQYRGLTDSRVPLEVQKRRVRANGSLAILVGPYSHPDDYSAVYEIRVADHSGDRVVDRSRDIDKHSLQVFAHSVSWRHGGELRSASFD